MKTIPVLSVRIITLEEPVPVYDLTTPTHHNFCLGFGVVVHNSKDVSDSAACSYYVLLKREANFASVSRKVVGGVRSAHRMSTGRHIKNKASRGKSGGRLRSKLSNRRI